MGKHVRFLILRWKTKFLPRGYSFPGLTTSVAALREAYEMASPNGILMPFIELGKGMRTITASALRDLDCEIPHEWPITVNRKSSSYAQHQAYFISNYKKYNDSIEELALSSREYEVLRDLYYGFSKTEIAAKQDLSINTVKMVARNIYEKLDAHSITDIVRIVAERNWCRRFNP